MSQVKEPALNQQDQVLVRNGRNKHIITEMVLSYFKGQLDPEISAFLSYAMPI